MKSFSACVQELLDAWISRGESAEASSLYQTTTAAMQANMVMAVIDCTTAEPMDFSVEFVRRLLVSMRN